MAMDGMYDRLCRAWPASLNAYIAACCMSSAVTCDDLRTGVAKPSCWARSSMTDTQIRSVSSTWAETHAKREQKVSAQQQCEKTLHWLKPTAVTNSVTGGPRRQLGLHVADDRDGFRANAVRGEVSQQHEEPE